MPDEAEDVGWAWESHAVVSLLCDDGVLVAI